MGANRRKKLLDFHCGRRSASAVFTIRARTTFFVFARRAQLHRLVSIV